MESSASQLRDLLAVRSGWGVEAKLTLHLHRLLTKFRTHFAPK